MILTITGSTGFLGSAMQRHFSQLGHTVHDVASLRLGDPVPTDLFAGVDCVVHAAWAITANSGPRNIEGTLALSNAAREQGVGKQIFLSSHSARPDAPGEYGAAKFAVEQALTKHAAAIVRPGLVTGPGGMFAKLAGSLLRHHISPLLYPDPATIAVLSLSDFLTAMTALLDRPAAEWNLFHPRLLTGREFAEQVWNARGVKGRCISVQPGLAQAALAAVGARELRDSVRSQLANRNPIHQSRLLELVPEPMDPAAAIAQAVLEMLE